MQSLIFFNKEGDNLNFSYSDTTERWEGSLIFDENGNDTFKTIGLYMFEKIPSFEYEVPGILQLEKFQLFNEYRFTISGCISSYMSQPLQKIEPVNTDSRFFSKWIWGDQFEQKFPLGSQIIFNQSIFEFTNPNKTFTVVKTKKNACLIISTLDNQSFDVSYGSLWGLTSSYTNITVSGVNSIGIYNYLTPSLSDNLSFWSEPDFYTKLYNDKKLTLLNTSKNNGVLTVNNLNLTDNVYYQYQLNASSLSSNQDIIVELIMKTELPVIYTGNLTLDSMRVYFGGQTPTILRPGVEFVIPSSVSNIDNIVVDSIPTFAATNTLTYYPLQSQVIWNNLIYECIQSYTWSATSSITPEDPLYWSSPTYVPVTVPLVFENLNNAECQLTTNKISYVAAFTQSNQVTLASAAQRYQSDFDYYKIDLYFSNNTLNADLRYPSKYAEVNFYQGLTGLGSQQQILEYNIGVSETLKPEVNKNTSQIYSYNLVFTDLDSYGLVITINSQIYQQEIEWVYVGVSVDLERTIDKTLKSWLSKWYGRLTSIGIIPTLQYVGSYVSIYYNSINLRNQYPNVPLTFRVEVGTTANFYIEHTEVLFYDMSNYLSININGRNYDEVVVVTLGVPDIPLALSNWIDTHSSVLEDYGIYVSNTNNLLKFWVKDQEQAINLTIKTGKSNLPGLEQYKIINKLKGSFGALITSNSIVLPSSGSYSFESLPFATGQIVSINNTTRPYNNQEYNILYLSPNSLVLSYQGPFFGTTDPFCDVAAYATIAFNSGFGATGCLPPIVPPIGLGGHFSQQAFTYSFSLTYASTNYYNTNIFSVAGNSNLIDLIHIPLNSSVYVLGDNLSVFDSTNLQLVNTIILSATNSISISFNPINSYLYCLSQSKLQIVDPLLNAIVSSISLNYIPTDLSINIVNGDVYVSYSNISRVDIWSAYSYSTTPTYTVLTTGPGMKLIFNQNEADMYVSQTNGILARINGTSRSISNSYSIPGLTSSLLYEPINSSIWTFDSSNLINLNNGVTQSFSGISTKTDNYLLFNSSVGEICLSQTNEYHRLDLTGNILSNIVTVYDGPMSVSLYDGDIYMCSRSSSQVLVFDSIFGNIKHTENFLSQIEKLIYQPDRKTMIGIQPGQNNLIEIGVTINSIVTTYNPTYSSPYQSYYGTLSPDYIPYSDIWLKTREYIRKPRENYNGDVEVQYVWKWETDEYPQIFMYDFSGNQLPTGGSYAYTGPKPLTTISLNKTPNKNINYVNYPEYQQTIFDEITNTLDFIDSTTDISFLPEPLELFIGFRGDDEGIVSNNLILYKRENIKFSITTSSSNFDIIQFKYVVDDVKDYGLLLLSFNSTSLFTFDSNNNNRGLKPGQLIQIFIEDVTNIKNKYVSINNGKIFKIREVYSRYLVVDFLVGDIIQDEFSQIDDYPKVGRTTYMKTTIQVIDKEIGRFNFSGQTEIEDIRYKTELSNVGQNINPEDIFIFKTYDISEQGIDWGFMNQKRKEMLMVRHDIFPYVGSYKAIINAINYFGYNDLELYEYYRNINVNSPDFFKLFKVEIPDIFDNTVEGWTVNDFIKHTMPNPNFEDTNLFNLTYLITDKQGNNVLMYSLQEVILKLQGLKYWLQNNVIPITHRILDITGRADFVGEDTIVHRNYDAKILNLKQSMTPVDFKLNEAYLMPVNSSSTVYTCHIDFYCATQSQMPDYFNIKIRTYKTYKEWNAFTTYQIGDTVTYYGKVYESVINDNKILNPRKYESVTQWDPVIDYTLGQLVNYNNYIYQYIGTQSLFTISGTTSNIVTPYKDILTNGSFALWVDITEWRNINYVPVQSISEFRTGTQSFNFTIDSNIDPFITIEVTSDNGYGQIYTAKKNYEIRGLVDLADPIRYIENIGPFVPIPYNINPGP